MISLEVDFKLKLDPVYFSIHMLGITPDPWQEKVLRSQGKRLILLCCRQSGKSLMSGILSLHKALYKPGSLILILSPTLRQSSELFKTINDLVERVSPRPVKIEDNRLSFTFENKSRIVSLPSREGTIRGYSQPDAIICDEASRIDDSVYFAARPMVSTNNGAILLLSTPNGRVGFFHDTYMAKDKLWERVKIGVKDCPRISADFLKEERLAMTEDMFKQEYEVQFIELEGEVLDLTSLDEAFTTDFDLFPGEALI